MIRILSVSHLLMACFLGLGGYASAANLPQFSPGADLFSLLDGAQPEQIRVGLDGAPPGPRGHIPVAPAQAGVHWLVLYRQAEQPVFVRFRVSGDEGGPTPLQIAVDNAPPNSTLRWQSHALQAGDRTVVGPAADAELSAEDVNGVAELQLWVDGQLRPDPATWSEGLASGPHSLSLRSVDRLGNSALHELAPVVLDREAPELHWQQIDAEPGVPPDVFNGRRATLRLQASDAVAGLQSLDLTRSNGKRSQHADGLAEIRVRAEELHWQAEDRVGNRSQGSLRLRPDREGPRLRFERSGEVLDPSNLSISSQDSLLLEAVDELAGVDHACVTASIWRRQCHALPLDLIGLEPGHYVIKLRARDRLGNRSRQRYKIEVQ